MKRLVWETNPAPTYTMNNSLPNYYWIKFQTDALLDPDYMRLTDAGLGAYLKLYLLAGRADAGGLLCNANKVYKIGDLASILRIQSTFLESYIAELKDAGLVQEDGAGFKISRFLAEQGPGLEAQRVQWRERQQKHREKAEKESKEDKTRLDKKREEHHRDITKCHGDKDNQKPIPLLGPMVEALSQVTGLDLTLNYPRLAKEAKDLQAVDYTPEQILKVYSPGGAWWTIDWRGKKGEPPQIALIRSTIAQLLSKKSNGRQPALEAQTQEETEALLDELQRPGGEEEGKSGH